MKRFMAFLMGLCLVLCPVFAFAAGTVTFTGYDRMNGAVRHLKIAWTADSSAHTVPSTSFSTALSNDSQTTATVWLYGYYICAGETSTVVGARPTTGYSITITDARGMDVMDSALTTLDGNNTAYNAVTVKSGSTTGLGCKFFVDPLTFNLTGNNVNSASGVLDLFFARPTENEK